MTTTFSESAVVFDCASEQLVGIVHIPEQPRETGVVIVVGGPQYRIGSHRQFLLLARALAAAGYVTMRFDYRGMGDSDGALRTFESISEDVRAAIDQLLLTVPSVKRVVLWGLCDGATAAGFYAPQDARVAGLVLLNPWVRSQQSLARSLLFHYYLERLTDWQAWWKLLSNRTALKAALHSAARVTRNAFIAPAPEQDVPAGPVQINPVQISPEPAGPSATGKSPPLLPRLSSALADFRGSILLLLSGADITANEFIEGERSDRRLRRRLKAANVRRHTLELADHTFARAEWRDSVAAWTVDWVRNLNSAHGRE